MRPRKLIKLQYRNGGRLERIDVVQDTRWKMLEWIGNRSSTPMSAAMRLWRYWRGGP